MSRWTCGQCGRESGMMGCAEWDAECRRVAAAKALVDDVVSVMGGGSVQWPPPFAPYGKTPRWRSLVIVTEKIDGTNVFIIVPEDESLPLAVGSRNRYISPGKSTDNYGFAGWVADNEKALRRLGPGRHDGEWWGVGIGRGYGLTERRWSLFQAHRWEGKLGELGLPAIVGVVPILARGEDIGLVETAAENLRQGGSVAAPGYMKPEGVIICHAASGFKPAKYVFENKVGPSPEEK